MSTIIRTEPRESDRLRRAAAGADAGPSDEGRETAGYMGSRLLQGLGDPQDSTSVSFPFLYRMIRDHNVAMALHYITMPLVKASFFFEADDARAAAFADNLIRPIFGSTVLTILRHLRFGYSPAVKNFEVVSPAWRYLVDGQSRLVWDDPVVGALIYKPLLPLRPESCRPHYDRDTGKFDGIQWDSFYSGPGNFFVGGVLRPSIPLIHSLWAIHDFENEHGSPYGHPRIAHCAPIFHMYRYIWTLLARAFENSADPGPLVRFPEDGPNRDPSMPTNKEVALTIGRRRRSGSTIAVPSEVHTDFQDRMTNRPKWDIEYPKVATDFDALQAFLGYLDAQKFRALWLPEQSLGEGTTGQSSRNVAASMSSQRDASQAVLMEQIVGVIMEQMVKPAMAINMPWYEGRLEMKTIGFGSDDEDIIRQVFQLAGQQDLSTFGIDVRRLAESKGFPMLDPDEQQRQMREAAAQADRSQAPAVTPTQGRRALVTQTGFGDMVYEQLHDPIALSSQQDGDFVASLPSTETWEARQVVDAARALRTSAETFLSQMYGDLAIYVSKQDLALADAPEDRFDLAIRDASTRMRALVQAWVPNPRKVARFADAARAALGRAYDRTVSAQLRRLGAKDIEVEVSSRDKLAARWLDERGAELVTGITQTTRNELSTFLSASVIEGKTAPEIAASIREHFSGFSETRATTIALTEVGEAYNFATVRTGIVAGVKKAQLVDGELDECAERNGRIVDIHQALTERLNHPRCRLVIRLLPNAPEDLTIERTRLDKEHLARYDEAAQVVLLSHELTSQEEAEYLLALGQVWMTA